MTNHGESSVEEILDSIKKVIARDARERDSMITDRRRRTSKPQPEAEEPEEVLELGEDVLLSGESEQSDERVECPDNQEVDDEADALTRGDTREAMRQNFAALAMLAKPGKAPQIVRQGETSLEGLAREMLRPMLAEWLDQNLPGMVEELVKAEIARIAGKRS